MSKKQTVGNVEFKSKKELDNYVHSLIENIYNNKDIINNKHEYFEFLVNLIKRHPDSIDKIGEGIEYFEVISPEKMKGLQLRIKNINEDKLEVCSWKKGCVDMKKKTIKENLNEAMRFSIEPQILNFKEKLIKENKYKCEKCNSNANDIDHNFDLNKTFVTLVKDFTDINDPPRDFKKNPHIQEKRLLFLDKDKEFENKWMIYHKENAILRPLCNHCHGTNKYKKKKLYEIDECLL